MHITILALGSQGDIVPLATLGKGLQVAGHQVRLATFENFSQLVTTHGLDFWPVQGDSQSIMNANRGLALAESGQSVIRLWVTVMRSFGALAGGYARDLAPLAQQQTDVIINQLPGGLYGYDLAQKLGVPMLMAAVMPLTPTGAFPMLGFPALFARFSAYNLLSYHLAQQMVWQWFRPTINHWRKQKLGLPGWPIGGYFGRLKREKIPILNGFSRHVVARPPDWGEHIHLTGYWFPEDSAWHPPDDLCRFIEAGRPPVFIGFGSMPVRNPERVTALILEALKQSGQRAILQAGWAGIGRNNLPDAVFKIDYAPYAWLFPQMAALVHHGGSGTTALGLRAGAPSLIIPFLFDQFYWGKRILALGVGPKPIPFKKLTAERLAQAISTATTDAQIGHRAAALADKIQQEDGIRKAVETICRYVT